MDLFVCLPERESDKQRGWYSATWAETELYLHINEETFEGNTFKGPQTVNQVLVD